MNKVFFVAVNNGYYLDGVPTNKCINFYKARSKNSLFCTIVGNIVIKSGLPSNSTNGIMTNNSRWTELAKAISDSGAVPGVQLSTTWPNYSGQHGFKNHRWISYERKIKGILEHINIEETFNNLWYSVSQSIDNGFKHIQIHAAHGYLFSALLDPNLYHYYPSVVAYLINTAKYIKSRGCTSSIRISLYCGFSEFRENRRCNVLAELIDRGFDYIDISEGYYNFDKKYIYPYTAAQLNSRKERSLKFADKNTSQNFIISGQLNPTAIFPKNVNIGICRELIANPMFLNNKTSICDNCGQCHYYSRGMSELMCPKWIST